ncbi:MAG TPA: hypothetical protein VFR85_19830 [Anaeromyxobacteraceae bacterium]|nr:hypothetical protein [Anaeromyxobacteraceae bacterium]
MTAPAQPGRCAPNPRSPRRAPTIVGKAFQAMVGVGLVGILVLGWLQATRADRLRARARAGGLAWAELRVREMG